jgi:hypothetical protein
MISDCQLPYLGILPYRPLILIDVEEGHSSVIEGLPDLEGRPMSTMPVD